jgi:hypothetical protein
MWKFARPLRNEFSRTLCPITSGRNEKIEEGVKRYGYYQREVADHLGMHSASVGRILRETKRMLTKET